VSESKNFLRRGALSELLRVTAGSSAFEDDTLRFARLVRQPGTLGWITPLDTVADLLEIAAGQLEKNPGRYTVEPPDAKDFLIEGARAAGMSPSEYLFTLADLLRPYGTQRPPSYEELPMNHWEVSRSFPCMAEFGLVWFEVDDSPTYEESLRKGIESERPEDHISLVLEIQRALLVFSTDDAVKRNNFPKIHWGSRFAIEEAFEGLYAYVQSPQ
jgi:hypothetical protein